MLKHSSARKRKCSKYSRFLMALDLVKLKSLFLILTARLITSGDFAASKKVRQKPNVFCSEQWKGKHGYR